MPANTQKGNHISIEQYNHVAVSIDSGIIVRPDIHVAMTLGSCVVTQPGSRAAVEQYNGAPSLAGTARGKSMREPVNGKQTAKA
jgi:hypothetical protein